MLYVVYLNATTIVSDPCLMGAFLMKSDAESFMKNHNLKDGLVLAKVNNVWNNWEAIREEIGKV